MIELVDEITSFVDNELKDSQIADRLQKLIDDDQNLRREYVIQKSIKNLLSERLSKNNPPSCLCERLRNKINLEIKKTSPNKKV